MTDKKNPRVAIYIRVSTREQSFASQLTAVRDYCRRRGWKKPKVYAEHGSGVNTSRPVLAKLLQDVRAGVVDVVAVYKLDRLGRSLSHMLQVAEEFSRLKIGLVATSQGLDMSAGSPVAELQRNILSSVASFERDLIRERVLTGLASAKRRGTKLGRPATDPGIILEILEGRRLGKKYTEIAEHLKVSIGLVCRVVNHAKSKGNK